jgi:hypothetical protein
VVHIAYAIPPQINIMNMFENWLYRIYKKTKAIIQMVVLDSCLSIFSCSNNIAFNNIGIVHVL